LRGRARASSAYHGGIGGESQAGSVPMLPPALAHGEFSLNRGVRRNALSLFLRVRGGQVVGGSHAQTMIVNSDQTTYDRFAIDRRPEAAAARSLLRRLSGAHETEELIAWTMIQYNSHFGSMLASAAETAAAAAGHEGGALAVGLLRAQPAEGGPATYVLAADAGGPVSAIHASLALLNYAHCSSPIRRYSDLHNQHALARTLLVRASSASSASTEAEATRGPEVGARAPRRLVLCRAPRRGLCRSGGARREQRGRAADDGRAVRRAQGRAHAAAAAHAGGIGRRDLSAKCARYYHPRVAPGPRRFSGA
jgi:hypothetical protein